MIGFVIILKHMFILGGLVGGGGGGWGYKGNKFFCLKCFTPIIF